MTAPRDETPVPFAPPRWALEEMCSVWSNAVAGYRRAAFDTKTPERFRQIHRDDADRYDALVHLCVAALAPSPPIRRPRGATPMGEPASEQDRLAETENDQPQAPPTREKDQ